MGMLGWRRAQFWLLMVVAFFVLSRNSTVFEVRLKPFLWTEPHSLPFRGRINSDAKRERECSKQGYARIMPRSRKKKKAHPPKGQKCFCFVFFQMLGKRCVLVPHGECTKTIRRDLLRALHLEPEALVPLPGWPINWHFVDHCTIWLGTSYNATRIVHASNTHRL